MPKTDTHQRALQVKRLGILTEQHDVFLQVIQTAIFMAADSLLHEGITKPMSCQTFKMNVFA